MTTDVSPEPRDPLSPPDAAALDALLDRPAQEAGENLASREISQERQARLKAWLAILAAAPVAAPAPDLAQRTMAAVQASIAQERLKFLGAAAASAGASLATAAGASSESAALARRIRSRRLAEFGAMAVAASLLVMVIIMGVSQARESSARTACADNLKKWATAFSAYAATYDNQLPCLAEPADGNWLHAAAAPGVAHSNAGNLLPLFTGHYLATTSLYCPGNPPPEGAALPAAAPFASMNDLPGIGYSYRCLYGPTRAVWNDAPAQIILGDRNPVFLPDADAPRVAAQHNSRNHNGKGNYLLKSDGSAPWETSPNAGPARDNIWTLAATSIAASGPAAAALPIAGSRGELIIDYSGTELPATLNDVFLCP